MIVSKNSLYYRPIISGFKQHDAVNIRDLVDYVWGNKKYSQPGYRKIDQTVCNHVHEIENCVSYF